MFLTLLCASLMLIYLVVQPACLWIAARLWRSQNLSLRRIAAASALLLAGNLAVLAIVYVTPLGSDDGSSALVTLYKTLIVLAIQFWLLVFCMQWALRTSLRRAAGIGLTAGVLHLGISLLMALALKSTFAEAFKVPTGAMALSIYGDHLDLRCSNCGHEFAVRFSPDRRPLGSAHCPNCEHLVDINPAEQAVEGDRLLVEKRAQVRRWDCVVCLDPANKQNYIHRLVGLPGETVDLKDGDLFIDGRRMNKAADEQLDLWVPVHDTGEVPKRRDDDTPGWRPTTDAKAWHALAGGGWRCDSLEHEGEPLTFSGQIADKLEYNLGSRPESFNYPVSDVRVQCTLDQCDGPGGLSLEWTFRGRTVVLRFSPGSGASIGQFEAGSDNLQELASDHSTSNTPCRVTYAIRDERAYVWRDGGTPLSAELQPAAASPATPDERGSCKLQLLADHCRVRVSRIAIDRDVYYLNSEEFGRENGGVAVDVELPLKLEANQLYFLGDNSVSSKDSRFDGPTTTDAVIGVARYRYWPPKRQHRLQ